MEITNESLPWDSENIDLFRAFLLTPTGQRLVPKLAELTPGLLPSGDTSAILIRSGEVRGCQEILKALLGLAVHPPYVAKSTSEYPALEDDSSHSDGQKFNE